MKGSNFDVDAGDQHGDAVITGTLPPPRPASGRADLFSGYRSRTGTFDEMQDEHGRIRPAWRRLVQLMGELVLLAGLDALACQKLVDRLCGRTGLGDDAVDIERDALVEVSRGDESCRRHQDDQDGRDHLQHVLRMNLWDRKLHESNLNTFR